jgi:hypothetical protein
MPLVSEKFFEVIKMTEIDIFRNPLDELETEEDLNLALAVYEEEHQFIVAG